MHLIEPLRQLVGSARCLLCTGRSSRLVCPACTFEMPWNHWACHLCAAPVVSPDIALCRYCARRAPPFDAAIAAFRYAAPVDRAIQGLKYNADFLAAHWLAESIVSAVRSRQRVLPELLVPVPLHRSRIRRRGYNQAQELAKLVGRELGLGVKPRLAQRLRATEDQIGKSAAERRSNLRGAFAVHESIQGRRIALIDDVMTTGSTLAELARACRKAGAVTVEAWVVARVE